VREKELVCKLLHRALVEIRDRGRESEDKTVFHLANLFHNTPMQLLRASDGAATDESLLNALRENAARAGCSEWLEARLNELEHSHAATNGGAG
jgi:hypothetical protein